MTKGTSRRSSGLFAPLALTLGVLMLAGYQTHAAKTLYFEDFQTYTTQNPAPNPLISGSPAGGQWYYIDPAPPLVAGEHFTPTATSIEGSRGWASTAANGRLTNAISLAALRPGAFHTFRLSFVAAGNNATVANACTFDYEISSSSGSLTFVSGRNMDDSQTFTGLSGTGSAKGGSTKSADRIFEFVFQGEGLTPGDTINFSITRVSGVPVANHLLLDDVRLESLDDIPFAVDSAKAMLTLTNVRVFFTHDIGSQAATNAANYSLSGGVSIQAVAFLSSSTYTNHSAVELTTTALTAGASYILQVSGLTSLNGDLVSGDPVGFIVPTNPVARTLYLDNFQSYPTQNPAPNPLWGGPAGGAWYFVDPTPPLAAGDHITTASGNIENSRGWASSVANARLTNAISLAALRPGAAHTFRLTFVAACVSTPLQNACVFDYEISSSSGSLTFVSGRNLDDSQIFTGLSGTGRAVGGAVKGLNRTFEFVFQGEGLTPDDTINFSITRVIGAPVVAVTFLLDDVRLQVQGESPSLYLGPAFVGANSKAGGVEITYRGILEATTNLANPTIWTPVATNISTSLATLLVSNNLPRQFFRAGMEFDWEEAGYNAGMPIQHGVLVVNGAQVNYKRGGQTVLKVTFGEPVVVAVATNEQPWGYFQFPGIRGTRDNDYLLASWSMAPDSVTSYGNGSSGSAVSKDGGRTWNPPAGENLIGGGTLLSNGDRIAVRTPAALPVSELQLPTPLDTRGSYVLYRMSELPEALQGVYINRMPVGTSAWASEHNALNDPVAVRYSVSGLFPVVWWGDMKVMPDGSIITGIYPGFYLNQNNQVPPSGVCFYRSTDHGHTWNIHGRIPYVFDTAVDPNGNNRTAFGFTEPAFEVLSNGTFLCVMRTSDGLGNSPMYRATSSDQGVTWTQPVAFTRSGVLPTLLQLENGLTVLAAGRPGMQLRFSFDGNGGEWTDPFDMLPFENIDGEVSCGYPGLLARGPDKFLLIYSDFKYVNDQGEIRKAIKVREVSVTRE